MSCRFSSFVRRLRAEPFLPETVAFLRQLDEHAPPVVRVGDPLDEPGLLHPVEPVRHRAARKLGSLGQHARRPLERRPAEAEGCQHLPLAEPEPELLQRLVCHRSEAAPQPVDAVDDSLDLGIDTREVDAVEPPVDVISLFFHPRESLIKTLLTSRVFVCNVLFRREDTLAREEGYVYDNDARTLIANEKIEQLRLSSLPTVSPIRLRLGDWLIRAGRRVLRECPERSALAHETLARRAY